MDNQNLTGPQLFARYVFVCAEDKVRQKELTRKNQDKLRQLIKNDLKPSIPFLKECFPKPAKFLTIFAVQYGLETWALSTVSRFWHEFHTHEEGKDVHRAIIFSIENGGKIAKCILELDNDESIVSNMYDLPIKKGTWVYLHKYVIVEIDKI
jgi:hypothetical protein